MRFFVPQAKRSQSEQYYQAILDLVKDQLGWEIADKRIYNLHHLHDKKEFHSQVGELDPHEQRYQVMAILESNAYIVFTRALDGRAGTTILVDKAEVLGLEEFDPKVKAVTS